MAGMHEIGGRCHCGNIEYLFISPISKVELPVRTCDCSFCQMQGACYTSHPQGRLRVRVHDRQQTSRYQFGTESADVLLCTKCGVFPLIVGDIDGEQYAVLNANSINGLQIDRAAIPSALQLENQSVEERIARWKKAWIPKVTIDYLQKSVNPAIL